MANFPFQIVLHEPTLTFGVNMNIEQAKRIPLGDILHILGFKPSQQKNYESWYLSPFRNEKTASLHVRENLNIWYDFGLGKGGDSIDLVRLYLQTQGEGHTIPDALRWMKNMLGYAPRIQPIAFAEKPTSQPKLSIHTKGRIEHVGLIHYLKGRGIPLSLAQRHFEQATLLNSDSGKTFFALVFRNEIGGYEIRNKFFKGSLGKKYIGFIRGRIPKPEGIHIFEGIMDYLSAVQSEKDWTFDDDSLILNSVAILEKATGYIRDYGYRFAYTWLDNDEAGKMATASLAKFFATQENLTHKPMNHLYAPHKDVNLSHTQKLGLK